MNEWKPIETAPKDGTEILTFRSAKLMAAAAWLQDNESRIHAVQEGCWCATDGMILTNVTHWMPLPEPPK